MLTNSTGLTDPVGIGVKWPLTFTGGRVALTSTTRTQVPLDSGISEGQVPRRDVLISTEQDQRVVVKQSLRRILTTPQGTRFMRGFYGSLVDLVVWESNDPTTRALAASYGAVAIQALEPRVTILAVEAGVPDDAPTTIEVEVSYQIQRTDVLGSAVVYDREVQV